MQDTRRKGKSIPQAERSRRGSVHLGHVLARAAVDKTDLA